ncbi:MAG: hypothetical protein QF515_19590 [Pseudomonadales bacterium]|nr:hypothetical protein [Pseudomonadales bacterium]MDP6472577.1 hypothetical protein [Pseudomonadales bacterium]MDP6829291.1 hypothetical protein [Pseudomonadales bacterium]
MRKVLLALLATLLIGTTAAWWWIQDANRLKPRLEAFLHAQTGAAVTIEGDLSWGLVAPISLTAERVSIDYGGDEAVIGQLAMVIDVLSLLRELRAIETWEVRSITITDAEVHSALDRITIHSLSLVDFALNRPTPFATSLLYETPGAIPRPIDANGLLVLGSHGSMHLANTMFSTTETKGVCDVDAEPVTSPDSPIAPKSDDLIPLDLLYAWDASIKCTLDQLELQAESFPDVHLTLRAADDRVTGDIEMPRFLGGSATTSFDLDARRPPLRWRLRPQLHSVDSQRLMNWLKQPLTWAAPLDGEGGFDLLGNTEAELIASIKGGWSASTISFAGDN